MGPRGRRVDQASSTHGSVRTEQDRTFHYVRPLLRSAFVSLRDIMQLLLLFLVHFSVREVKQHTSKFQANSQIRRENRIFFSRNGYVLRYPAFKALESPPLPLRI